MLFFSVFAILGFTYKGSSESYTYTLYLILSSLFAYIFIFYDLFKIRFIKSGFYFFSLMPLIFLVFYFLTNYHDFVNNQSKIFFVLVLPSFFLGYIIPRRIELNKILIGFILTSFIVVTAVLRVLPRIIELPVIELMDVFGGGQYQAFSYFCSFAFLILFRQFLSFKQKKKLLRILYILSFLTLISGVILSGGRGGFIVVFIGICILLIRYYGIFKFGFYFLFFLILLISSFPILSYYEFEIGDRIFQSFDRLFSFISSDGINMEGSSNRDSFYNSAIELIIKSPILGYGLFGTVKYLGDYYPHNLFLEVLLQGGILYLSIFIVVLIFFFIKLSWILKHFSNEDLILIPIIYVFIMLLFSSSYIQEPFFWFTLTYVLFYPNKIKEINE